MLLKKLTWFLIVLALGFNMAACSGGNEPAQQTKSKPSKEALMAKSKSVHAELDRLELAGDYQGMLKYLADDMVRMDAGRPLTNRKEAWLDFTGQMKARNIKVEKISRNIVDIWQSEDRVYEYGTVDATVQFPSGVVPAEPVNYFNIWEVQGDTWKSKLFIWNTGAPVEQLKELGKP